PSKIEAVKNWEAAKSPTEGDEQDRAFQILKDKVCNAPVLALPDRPEDFVVYCDASGRGLGLGCMLMQRDLKTLLVWDEERHIYRPQECPTYLQLERAEYASTSLDRAIQRL
ncbi:putative reverse transcriptase domain-containing protein, partial [Tanacetum coccineum]